MKYDRKVGGFIHEGKTFICACKPCDVCLAIGPCRHCVRSCAIIKRYIRDDVEYLLDDD